MNPFLKVIIILFSIFCLIQAVEMARLKRDEKTNTSAKKPTNTDGDVKVLGEILIKKLEESLKDCDQTIKVNLLIAVLTLSGKCLAASLANVANLAYICIMIYYGYEAALQSLQQRMSTAYKLIFYRVPKILYSKHNRQQ